MSLACDLAPCPGYPWWLRCDVSYHLDPEGSLEVEMGALNCSDRAAPFGAGFHPYLDPGEGGVDSVASLTLPAGRRLILDGRGIPRSSESVLGGPYDFSAGRPLIGMRLDDCFTELPETWTARLQMSDGSVTELWADAAWRYAMCFTADTLAGPDKRRAVAIEPMTCPPNAFRSAEGLVCLGPGERFSARFGIRRLRGQ